MTWGPLRSRRAGRGSVIVVMAMALALLALPGSVRADDVAVFDGTVYADGGVDTEVTITAHRVDGEQWSTTVVAGPSWSDKGEFRLEVPAGSYRVEFAPRDPIYATEFHDGSESAAEATPVEIAAGEVRRFTPQLGPSTRIEGRITDRAGRGVDGSVYLERLDNGWHGAGGGLVDEEGHYVVGTFRPGTYRVRFGGTDHLAPARLQRRFVLDHPGERVTGQDIALPPAGHVTGRVTDARGHPPESTARVELRGVLDGAGNEGIGSYDREVWTDEAGGFEFHGLPAGRYRLHYEVLGSERQVGGYWPNARPRHEDAQHIVVDEGRTVALGRAVLRDAPPPYPMTPLEPPTISGEPVVGQRLTANPGFWAAPRATFDYRWLADGRFVPGAQGRTFVPRSQDRGKPIAVLVIATSETGDNTGFAFSRPTPPVRRSMNGKPASPRSGGAAVVPTWGFGKGTISGRVIGPGGAPLEGASVHAYRYYARGDDPDEVDLEHQLEVLTDADGRYELFALPPAEYVVSFESPSDDPRYQAEAWRGADEEGDIERLIVEDDETYSGIDAHLARASTIEGRVTDASGSPVPFAEVYVLTPEGGEVQNHRAPVVADASGRYVLPIVPGTYRVRYDHPQLPVAPSFWPVAGGVEAGSNVEVRAGQGTTGIDGTLVAGSRIQGSVSSARTGVRVFADITVYRWAAGTWEFESKGVTDWYGRFDMPDLPAGTYRLFFDAYPPFIDEFWSGAATIDDAQDIVVPPMEVVRDIDVTLEDAQRDWPIRVINRAPPRIEGTPEVGHVLKVTKGSWTPETAQLRFQWLADGRRIVGATSRSFRVPKRLVGDRIKVAVKAVAPYWQPEVVRTRPTAKVTR